MAGHAHNWKGGRVVLSGGYIGIYMPERAYPNSHGYVFEHRLVAERALGKPLPPGAQVHHFDGDRTNNAPTNLVICPDDAYHALIHQRKDALDACGDPNARCCTICHSYDNQSDIAVYARSRRKRGSLEPETLAVHRACNRRRVAELKARRRGSRESAPIGD